MLQAVLFDLDDTLLGNSMERFMPAYFDLISRYAQGILERRRFLQELVACTDVVVASVDGARTNREVFWQAFQQRNGLDPAELEPFFHRFYLTEFGQLQAVTEYRPTAVSLVRACFQLGLQVVIATNPLFPRPAIEQRLAWAGVPVSEFDYALVTTYENMHATKPHHAYYREILQQIGCEPHKALMVGDGWEQDIVPAAEVGMWTYWLPPAGESVRDSLPYPTRWGTLDELYALVQAGWLQNPGRNVA